MIILWALICGHRIAHGSSSLLVFNSHQGRQLRGGCWPPSLLIPLPPPSPALIVWLVPPIDSFFFFFTKLHLHSSCYGFKMTERKLFFLLFASLDDLPLSPTSPPDAPASHPIGIARLSVMAHVLFPQPHILLGALPYLSFGFPFPVMHI